MRFEKSEFLKPLRDPRFRVVLVLWPLFNGVVQIMGPFFPYFFTREVEVSMSRIALWILVGNVGSLMTVGYLGARIDRTGNALEVLLWMGVLLAVSPLLYVLPSKAAILWIAPPEHFLKRHCRRRAKGGDPEFALRGHAGGKKFAVLLRLYRIYRRMRRAWHFYRRLAAQVFSEHAGPSDPWFRVPGVLRWRSGAASAGGGRRTVVGASQVGARGRERRRMKKFVYLALVIGFGAARIVPTARPFARGQFTRSQTRDRADLRE